MWELLKTLYEVLGVPHPHASIIGAALIGALLFGTGWWLLGKQYEKTQGRIEITSPSQKPDPAASLTQSEPKLGASQLPLSWNKAAGTAVIQFQDQMPQYGWGSSHTAYMDQYVVSKGRAVGTLVITAKTDSSKLTDKPRVVERHEVTFDRTGDIIRRKPIRLDEKISFPQPFDIQGGRCPAGTTWLTFPVAFSSTPTVIVTPISDTFRQPMLRNVSTTSQALF